ncbi:MAG: hypothetical protein KDD69_00320 [Bdellovibrionales bacterium]|nr:hypothetical protein [Bdellovibrionales bacterium]
MKRYSLRYLFVVIAAVAFFLRHPTEVKQKIELENAIVAKLTELGCSVSRNPDERREVFWLFEPLIGHHVGTSVDFVSLGEQIHTPQQTDEIVDLCARLPDLEGISFDLAEPSVTALQRLEHLPLRIVNLGYVRNSLSDEHCKALSRLSEIEHITMRVGSLSEQGLRHVRELPSLRRLHLTVLPGTPTARYATMYDVCFTFVPPPDQPKLNMEPWQRISDYAGDLYQVQSL